MTDRHSSLLLKNNATSMNEYSPQLSSSELESLALILDRDAMATLEQSVQDARQGDFILLEDAVGNY